MPARSKRVAVRRSGPLQNAVEARPSRISFASRGRKREPSVVARAMPPSKVGLRVGRSAYRRPAYSGPAPCFCDLGRRPSVRGSAWAPIAIWSRMRPHHRFVGPDGKVPCPDVRRRSSGALLPRGIDSHSEASLSIRLPRDRPPALLRHRGPPEARSVPSELSTGPDRRRFTRDEYYRMAGIGLFERQRVELVEGEILRKSPHRPRHATAIVLASALLQRRLPRSFAVRVQSPLAIDSESEPEPDVAVIRGHHRDFLKRHPSTADLVIEIADSSLSYDRTTKARLYARCGVPDYWIVDLVHGCLEVRREPAPVRKGGTRAEYGLISIHRPGAFVRPLLAPKVRLAVKDLLP